MSANQLPENMGKKIVEALKKQALMEEQGTPIQNTVNENINSFSGEAVIKEAPLMSEKQVIRENLEPDEQMYSSQMSNTINSQMLNQTIKEASMQFSIPNTVQSQNNNLYSTYSPELPTNVAVLKKLILQLPAGVSKQVGAQIIRQTIEALGISMNSVLQEAQQVQESLNNSVTDCSIKIQEYKNQILQLEANARDYQRQMAQINDLISLFILTDNKKLG